MDNIVTALLRPGGVTTTRPLYQYDYGQILVLTGHELPPAYEVHFANAGDPVSKTQIGGADGVSIPDEYLESGAAIHAWLFLHAGPNDGETKAMIIIPVKTKIKTGDEEPVPVEQSVITQAIAALNDGVSRAEAAANGIAQTVADALEQAKASGEFDGPPGKDGKDGKDGTDGYTPVKGIDYFDGQDGAPGKDGKAGQDGQPGRDGEDGEPGQDGVSPTITVTDITGGHRVTITDATGAHSFDVMNGQDGAGAVQDVQVNGVSVVSDGVANMPYAYTNIPGLMQPSDGLMAGSSREGRIMTRPATSEQIKAGIKVYEPLSPVHQHESAFYGLAKAAGDTTQSASSNAVGTYTDAAKSAILTMLGFAGIIGNAEGATSSKAYDAGDAFLHAGALYKATTAIAANDAIVPGTNCEQTTILELLQEE